MANPFYIGRKFSAEDKAILAEYTNLAGQLIWASNALHAEFMAIFGEVFLWDCEANRSIKHRSAQAVWHSLRSDDAQRSMLLAMISEAFEPNHPLTKSLTWTIKSAGKLSEFRNDVAHTPFEFSKASGKWMMVPNHFAGAPQRVEKLNRVGPARLFKLAIGDLLALRTYADAIHGKLVSRKPTTLPRRPRLQASQLVQRTPPKSSTHQDRVEELLRPLQSFHRSSSEADKKRERLAAALLKWSNPGEG